MRAMVTPLLLTLGGMLVPQAGQAAAPTVVPLEAESRHVVVAADPRSFLGWPSINGFWIWEGGREMLVGYSAGRFAERTHHNIKPGPVQSRLARSRDGGRSWTTWDPTDFVGDGGERRKLPAPLPFTAEGFALRAVGTGYHGSSDPLGSFFTSLDRGDTWTGPFGFAGLPDAPEMKDGKGKLRENTTRTSYLVTGSESCLFFMSARRGQYRDKCFVASTDDGGRSVQFRSWIVPPDDPHRAVMPAAVRRPDGEIVVALRRRVPDDAQAPCWIDAYASADEGRTWSYRGRVDETGTENGNPPALVGLPDGRLACCYGDRAARDGIFLKLSDDAGRTWGEALPLRTDYQADRFDDSDLGYPVAGVNDQDELVVIYYWATRERPAQHIAATLVPLAALPSGAASP